MKTYYLFTNPKIRYSVVGFVAILMSSCGSYQNTSYNDNDGIYDNGQRRTEVARSGSDTNGYKEYFVALQEDNAEIFTDVENYSTPGDSTQTTEERGYATGYAAWGSDSNNVTVNVYDNSWGYSPWNYWYGPSYGWGWGWNTGWGWGYPGISFGWGWNNWYGPGYYGWGYPAYYGHSWYNHHHHHHYAHNSGIRGVRNEMYGNRSNVGRRYNSQGTRSTSYSTTNPRRSTITNGTRSAQYNNGTRSTQYNNSGTRSTTIRNNSGTRSNYTPSTRSTSRSSNYAPSTRSSSSGYSGGGRSYGGGGRSSGGRR